MKEILFATGNTSKAKRFEKGLSKNNIKLLTLNDINLELDINENGTNAIENALIKARTYYNETKIITLAMDDNLYLDGVPDEKQPGTFVRRVNGKRLNDEEMLEHYTNLVKKYGKDGKLIARWIYGIAIIKDGVEKTYTWSKKDFYLVDKKTDIVNEGYPLNSISINIQLNKYFTDMTESDKLLTSETEDDVIDFIIKNV